MEDTVVYDDTESDSCRDSLVANLTWLCKSIVWERDRNRCVKCDRNIYGELGDVSHVYSKGRYVGLRFDLWNLKLLCPTCHLWWHNEPQRAMAWFSARWPERAAYLMQEAMRTDVVHLSDLDSLRVRMLALWDSILTGKVDRAEIQTIAVPGIQI